MRVYSCHDYLKLTTATELATLEAQVRGEVQAGHAGADLAQAPARQHDQAAPGGEAHLSNLTHNLMIRAVIRCAFPSF